MAHQTAKRNARDKQLDHNWTKNIEVLLGVEKILRWKKIASANTFNLAILSSKVRLTSWLISPSRQ
jgi:hypothetical protein